MRLYKPTHMGRATCDKAVRCVVHGDPDAPDHSYRDVQLVIPDDTIIFAGLFHANINVTNEIGADRSYNMAPMSAGAQITFKLVPEQTLWIMAETGLGFCGVIIEYIEDIEDIKEN